MAAYEDAQTRLACVELALRCDRDDPLPLAKEIYAFVSGKSASQLVVDAARIMIDEKEFARLVRRAAKQNMRPA